LLKTPIATLAIFEEHERFLRDELEHARKARQHDR
jgi:hypothetical protein